MSDYISSDLNNIFIKRPYKRNRVSSYAKDGSNADFVVISPNENKVVASINGPAVINHFWCTMGNVKKGDKSGACGHEKYNARKVILRVYWDDEENPSIEVPIGDFFGMGHGITRNFTSAAVEMSALNGHGFNCWLPMPFKSSARFEIENNCINDLRYYFYIDYEEVDKLPENSLYLHACWNRVFPSIGKDENNYQSHTEWIFGNKDDLNIDGKNNYVILDAMGSGQYVGCNLNIANCNTSNCWDWYGEGDDMIFIDGEPWPPKLHGTGLEDYFNCAWSPTETYTSLYHGVICDDKSNFKGKHTYYRYHIKDPIAFNESIKVTIETGHNNNRSDDYSSTAYFYQSEPHQEYPKMLEVAKRMPLDEHKLLWNNTIDYEEVSDDVEYDS